MKHFSTGRRAIATSVLAIGSIVALSACGTSSGGGGEATPEATELGDYEGTVSILAWPGYVEDGSNDPAVDWVSGFEDLTGCVVESKSYGTSMRRSAS